MIRSSTVRDDVHLRDALSLREHVRDEVDAFADARLRDELGGDPHRVALRRRLHHHHRGGRAGTAVQRAVVAGEVGREHEVRGAAVGSDRERDQREVRRVRVGVGPSGGK